MAPPKNLDKSIDRGLDDFGRFLKRRWLLLIVGAVVIWWFIAGPPIGSVTPSAALGLLLQLAFAASFLIIQFAALFLFLARPRVYWIMPGEEGNTFDDYKGNPEVLDAARRIVILIRGVKRFKDMGGEVSRGLLLVGPPGTGKSYLAQCISTEAGVPFCYASAASLQNMFLGIDVLIIKNLYRKARRYAREYGGCILFLDEFDAIGASRSSRGGQPMMGGGIMGMMSRGSGGLNELLMQMDPPPLSISWWRSLLRLIGIGGGRRQVQPVLTIGATNLPESLDPALLRPGRFDRKIVVAAPSDANRAEVIEYYLSKVTHDPMPMQKLVSDMMGYSPVAIKHVINEAVVIALFAGRESVTYKDIGEARETHEFGIRYPRTLSALEKRRLAYHEAGHSIAQVKLLPRHRVTRVTIAKRLGTDGEAFAAYKPMEEIVTESADEVFADIQTSLASRASEELFLETRLNGVGGDLAYATQRALHYLAHWGMGDEFFSAMATLAPERMYTDPVLRKEVEALLRKAYTEVRALLDTNRAAVIAVAEALVQREELDGDEILTLIAQSESPDLSSIAAAALAAVPPVPALSQPMVTGTPVPPGARSPYPVPPAGYPPVQMPPASIPPVAVSVPASISPAAVAPAYASSNGNGYVAPPIAPVTVTPPAVQQVPVPPAHMVPIVTPVTGAAAPELRTNGANGTNGIGHVAQPQPAAPNDRADEPAQQISPQPAQEQWPTNESPD
ncbi:MAG TPA: AAA family ATPase [Ktedonobacterales bacterium]|nr:AAA family ATPase [Ktedonobacterales bacterium]